MTPAEFETIKIITDLLFMATSTLQKISKMSEEEVKQQKAEAKLLTDELKAKIESH